MAPAGRNQALALGAEQLTPRQRQAALLLAQGALPHAVAAQIPVGVSTLRRWRQTPGFQAELARHLAAAEADAHAQLRAALPVAIAGLVELAQEQGNPSVRLGACNAITRVWAKHVEEQLVQAQIRALEGQVTELLEQLAEQRRQGWRP